jgi:hypothetical protein
MIHRFAPVLIVVGVLLTVNDRLWAGSISVPNASFEAPVALFPTPSIDSWQKTPTPEWYDEGGGGFLWSQLTGTFRNPPPSSPSNHIVNCDGLQAIWMFAVPEVCLFQDYDSMDWNDPEPSHAFDATFEPGKSYQLSVGVVGTGGGMQEGVTLELSLYYRDAASNRVVVAATTVTNTPAVFTTNTILVDFQVTVPVVKPDDVWAGKHIGIQFLSTVSPELEGGYWDLDNVRLVSIQAPIFLNPTRANGEFHCTIESEPGLRLEIFASPELSAPPENWTSLGIITNSTGTIPFVDSTPGFDQRYYQARQVP